MSADIVVEKSFGMDEPIDIDQFDKKKKNRKNKSKPKNENLSVSEDYIIIESEANNSMN